jgi:hypothetical protein
MIISESPEQSRGCPITLVSRTLGSTQFAPAAANKVRKKNHAYIPQIGNQPKKDH